VIGAAPGPRQHAIERHAPQPLDRGRHVAGSSPTTTMAASLSSAAGSTSARIDRKSMRRKPGRAGQHLGARAADDVGDLDGAKARVDRDGDGAEPGAGEIEDRVGRHVGQPQRDTVAGPDAEIGQALRGAQRSLVQFPEGDRPVAVQERGCAGRLLRPFGKQLQTSAAGMASGMIGETSV
jgi:hypothetical protein